MLISIVIPLYNKERTVSRTLSSVFAQSYGNFEVIVVDDGSSDNSVHQVLKFSDSRLRLIRQSNRGPGAARNAGIAIASGVWTVLLDADDELLPFALEHFVSLISKYPKANIIDCKRYICRGNKLYPAQEYKYCGYIKSPLKSCYFGEVMPGCGFSIFQTNLIRQIPYDECLRRFEDAEWLLRLLPLAVIYSDDTFVSIYNHDHLQASSPRLDISEDYAGHLTLHHKSFWSKMCVYRSYLENIGYYPIEMHRLYPSWRFRYDLLIIHWFLQHTRKKFL